MYITPENKGGQHHVDGQGIPHTQFRKPGGISAIDNHRTHARFVNDFPPCRNGASFPHHLDHFGHRAVDCGVDEKIGPLGNKPHAEFKKSGMSLNRRSAAEINNLEFFPPRFLETTSERDSFGIIAKAPAAAAIPVVFMKSRRFTFIFFLSFSSILTS